MPPKPAEEVELLLSIRLLILSLIIGAMSALAIVLFVRGSEALMHLLYFGDPFETYKTLPVWYLYLIPTLALMAVHWLIALDPGVREYGVAEIAEAVSENRFFITIRSLFLKILASAISLGSGYAVGNEGPSAAIGAMVAHQTNRFIEIPRRYIRLILSIGAGSGIAAVFVSPLTGIIFAIENIAYDSVRKLPGPIILGGTISFTVAYQFLDPLIFHYSTGKLFQLHSLLETLLFVPFIVFFLYLYLESKHLLFRILDRIALGSCSICRVLFFSILGGGTVGTLMYIDPATVFSGHRVVELLINDRFHIPLGLLLIVIMLRILSTTLSLYVQAVGGLFLPLMSLGGLIGYGYGELLSRYAIAVEPYSFAAIGAAVFMGVIMRLPLTAIVLALEITYDYNIVVPTGIGVVLASYLVHLRFKIQRFSAFRHPNVTDRS